ncbi:hypothetical protein ACP275_10G127000 [Erythranthe tilingii]
MGVKYAECNQLHKHMGWKTDGCQEYGGYGLYCQICECHQNFHRKVEAVPPKPVVDYKTEVVYTKCNKIHDFRFQTTVDGCQEFTPNSKEGSSDNALTCGVC